MGKTANVSFMRQEITLKLESDENTHKNIKIMSADIKFVNKTLEQHEQAAHRDVQACRLY